MTKQLELYREAIQRIKAAEGELDQAHAILKDLSLDNYLNSGPGPVQLTIKHLSRHTGAFIESMLVAECPDCEHPLSRHHADCGCDAETTDGVCLCRWGSLPVEKREAA